MLPECTTRPWYDTVKVPSNGCEAASNTVADRQPSKAQNCIESPIPCASELPRPSNRVYVVSLPAAVLRAIVSVSQAGHCAISDW